MSQFNTSALSSILNATQPYGGYTQGAKAAFDAKSEQSKMSLASGIGAITEAYGAITEGLSRSAANLQNASLAEQDILALELRGEQDLDQSRQEGRMLLARQVAITASTGRSFSGSALDVMARSERQSLEEQNIINHNMRLSIAAKQNQAATARTESRIATRAGYAKAFTQLLNSATAQNAMTEKTGKNSGKK